MITNVSFEGFPFEVGQASKEYLLIPRQGPTVSLEEGDTICTRLNRDAHWVKEDVLRIIGVILLIAFESFLQMLLTTAGTSLPPSVAGLFLLFGMLCTTNSWFPELASATVDFFTPTVVFFSRWLGLLFVPSLVCIPNIADRISLEEIPLAMLVIALKTALLIALAGLLCKGILRLLAFWQHDAEEELQPVQKASLPPPLPTMSFMLRLLAALICSFTARLVLEDPTWIEAALFIMWMAALFLFFSVALHLQRAAGRQVSMLGQLLQPVVLTAVGLLGLMYFVAQATQQTLQQSIAQFSKGKGVLPPAAGDVMNSFLSLAVISMAFGMFRNRKILALNFALILLMTFLIATFGLLGLAFGGRLCGLSPTLAISLVPTTATTPLAMESTRMLGDGDPKLTATGSIFAGVVGALLGRLVLNGLGIHQALVRGIALGGCSHGVATGMLVMEEPAAAPFSATSFAFVGSITATLMSFAFARNIVLMILGLYIEFPFDD